METEVVDRVFNEEGLIDRLGIDLQRLVSSDDFSCLSGKVSSCLVDVFLQETVAFRLLDPFLFVFDIGVAVPSGELGQEIEFHFVVHPRPPGGTGNRTAERGNRRVAAGVAVFLPERRRGTDRCTKRRRWQRRHAL